MDNWISKLELLERVGIPKWVVDPEVDNQAQILIEAMANYVLDDTRPEDHTPADDMGYIQEHFTGSPVMCWHTILLGDYEDVIDDVWIAVRDYYPDETDADGKLIVRRWMIDWQMKCRKVFSRALSKAELY